ncbi:hypothetical protein F4818DRAFT_93561 [Hypoxylon cercidicola]|nr:hypothetical protein F4818DRAFT_93561 [Hypoxylon cercidicola]
MQANVDVCRVACDTMSLLVRRMGHGMGDLGLTTGRARLWQVFGAQRSRSSPRDLRWARVSAHLCTQCAQLRQACMVAQVLNILPSPGPLTRLDLNFDIRNDLWKEVIVLKELIFNSGISRSLLRLAREPFVRVCPLRIIIFTASKAPQSPLSSWPFTRPLHCTLRAALHSYCPSYCPDCKHCPLVQAPINKGLKGLDPARPCQTLQPHLYR